MTPSNLLLARLPPEDYKRIFSEIVVRPLKPRQILQKRDEPLREVYFPGRSLCSLVVTTADGATAEVAVAGSEGLVGVEAVLSLRLAMCDSIVQIAGDGIAYAMTVDAFRREVDRGGAFHATMTRFGQACIGFIMQSVACNGLHSAEARCCRWLLHAHDRLARDEFPLTHELLSTMLGVRRPTVTLILAELVRLGLISTTRGGIRIADRPGLSDRSCECYKTVKGLYKRILPFEAARSEAQAS